ncbi:hypothetical protein BKA61DRAFT_601758 [Leptodontidium sp. MPI-SDFR-AT-0119]|nr:hypothetical protein BKA61DRAFT_601758 [Leptodontidium sp. MPI-SDFR-AT-0119]
MSLPRQFMKALLACSYFGPTYAEIANIETILGCLIAKSLGIIVTPNAHLDPPIRRYLIPKSSFIMIIKMLSI